MAEVISIRNTHQAHCKDCSLATLCLPLSLESGDLNALDAIVKRSRPLKKVNICFARATLFAQSMQCVPAV